MLYCLNPACLNPENPNHNRYCQGCGVELAQSTKSYRFREHYLVQKMLGQGAFGRTYQVEDLDLMNEPRVIKKLIAQGEGTILTKAQELFRREAEQLYQLNHPQIPKLYAYFEQDNSLYLVQEFIDGKNLLTELNTEGKFNEAKIIDLLKNILPVLDYLHNNQILHRDIKPENIMRRHHNQQLVLIDFGGAKQINQQTESASATRIYTLGYAAMEQIRGKPKPASDIYSLGITCIHLLAGGLPLNHETGELQEEFYDDNGGLLWQPYLQEQAITISDGLIPIFEKMLAILPQNRYQSAQEVLRDIHNFLNPQQSSAILSTSLPQSNPSNVQTVTQLSVNQLNKSSRKSTLLIASLGIIAIAFFLIPLIIITKHKSLTNQQVLGLVFVGAISAAGIGSIMFLKSKNKLTQLSQQQPQSLTSSKVSSTQNPIITPPSQPSLINLPINPVITPPQIKTQQPSIASIPNSNQPITSPLNPASSNQQATNQASIASTPAINLKTFNFQIKNVDYRGNIINTLTKQVRYFAVELIPGISIDLVLIPAGKFMMGSPNIERERNDSESPEHEVNIAEFYMSKYPITQTQWSLVMGNNPSYFKGANLPVETISWIDSVKFCLKLSQQVGMKFRLPSEAEWEYACRAGTNTPFYCGETINTDLANYDGNSSYSFGSLGINRCQTTTVGTFPPNAFGLSDMHGNVWEWCADTWHSNYLDAPNDGTIWDSGANQNIYVKRGGSWRCFPKACRSAMRTQEMARYQNNDLGFRIVYPKT